MVSWETAIKNRTEEVDSGRIPGFVFLLYIVLLGSSASDPFLGNTGCTSPFFQTRREIFQVGNLQPEHCQPTSQRRKCMAASVWTGRPTTPRGGLLVQGSGSRPVLANPSWCPATGRRFKDQDPGNRISRITGAALHRRRLRSWRSDRGRHLRLGYIVLAPASASARILNARIKLPSTQRRQRQHHGPGRTSV